jgi:bifunctional non-homologous end joining protein LigD
MKALLRSSLPEGTGWVYEIKFDGVRAVGIKRTHTVELLSRAGNNLCPKYPAVERALQRLRHKQLVLDGEIVALDEQGRSSFQLLQNYCSPGKQPPLVYYVFDLLNLDGKDLRSLPFSERKELLRKVLVRAPESIRFSPAFSGESSAIVREVQARGLEGVVAKRRDSAYESGKRSGHWIKYKWCARQEFVIGGYTPPKGGRGYFGSLLVGYFEHQTLLFAARVGTGFSFRMLKDLHSRFQPLVRPDCPFANAPEILPSPGTGLTAGLMRRCTWLEPKLVCEVRFSEWTRDNHLRQPAFVGLREDKKPREVVRERARS